MPLSVCFCFSTHFYNILCQIVTDIKKFCQVGLFFSKIDHCAFQGQGLGDHLHITNEYMVGGSENGNFLLMKMSLRRGGEGF